MILMFRLVCFALGISGLWNETDLGRCIILASYVAIVFRSAFFTLFLADYVYIYGYVGCYRNRKGRIFCIKAKYFIY
jgi:hypothetical protein